VSVYFFDSSALVKRYVSETGTVWVANITDISTGNRIHIVRITGVEVISAITRRVRGESISIASAAAAIALFQPDFFSNYVATEVTSSLVGVAMHLAERYALRGYDAAATCSCFGCQCLLAFFRYARLNFSFCRQ